MRATQSHPAKRCGRIIYKIEKSRLPSTPKTRCVSVICVTKDIDFWPLRETQLQTLMDVLIAQTPASGCQTVPRIGIRSALAHVQRTGCDQFVPHPARVIQRLTFASKEAP
jgi:hypothetical protein